MQQLMTSRGPAPAQLPAQRQPVTASEASRKDGSLLLCVDKGLVISINRIATLIWTFLEQNPKGITLPEIVNYVERSCSEPSNKTILRANIERDVSDLLIYLEQRQVIKKKSRHNSSRVYQIVKGILRTQTGATLIPGTEQEFSEFAGEPDAGRCVKRLLTPVSKDPTLDMAVTDQIAQINSHKSTTYTLIAFFAFAAYDALMKLLGFAGICRILTRGVPGKRRIDLVRLLRVCAGIERARIWYPKTIMCMQHSAVIKFLLMRCGLNPRLAIAGRIMPFQSHAWVEIDGTVINDTQKVQSYYSVFTYL
jgi:hypothetical protein